MAQKGNLHCQLICALHKIFSYRLSLGVGVGIDVGGNTHRSSARGVDWVFFLWPFDGKFLAINFMINL